MPHPLLRAFWKYLSSPSETIERRESLPVVEPRDRPISYIHQTGDGPVHLLVRASRRGWDSLHWGRRHAAAWTFETMAEANRFVLHRFRKLYYGHRCSTECGPAPTIAVHQYDDPWGMLREL